MRPLLVEIRFCIFVLKISNFNCQSISPLKIPKEF